MGDDEIHASIDLGIDDGLPEELEQALRDHLSRSERARRDWDTLRETREALRVAPRETLDPWMKERLLQRVLRAFDFEHDTQPEHSKRSCTP